MFCFVSDSALRKAKENGTEPEYKAIPTDEYMDGFSTIVIRISVDDDKPRFDLTVMQ